MIYLLDKDETLLENGIIPRDEVLESWQEQEINGLTPHTVESKYRKEIDEAQYFGVKDPEQRGLFWFYKIVARSKDDNPAGEASIRGINKLFDDLKGKGYVQDLRPQQAQFSEYIDKVLEGTGWSVGVCNVSRKVNTNLYYISKLEAFWKLIESAQCEFTTRVRFQDGKIIEQIVDFYDEISIDNGRIYVHGDKLLNVVAQTSDEFIPTAFLPRGKGIETEGGGYGRKLLIDGIEWSLANGNPINKVLGSPILELADRTEIYGYKGNEPRLQIIDFEEIEDPNLLIQACYEYALENSRQKFQYETRIVDDERVVAGELVRIKSPKINAVYKVRIFKVRRNFLNPKIKEVELGDKIITSRAEKTIQAKRIEEKKEEVYISRLEAVRESIEKDWFGGEAYNKILDNEQALQYGIPAGFYSFNAPIDENPTELIGMSGGKLIIAHKDESGNWIPLTGADGYGIHGENIIANTISVNKVNADFGKDLDLSSNESISLRVENYITDNKDMLKGEDGNSPYIQDGYWWIGTTNLGVKALGQDGLSGQDGATPVIQNGFWYINGVSTGIKAEGQDGSDGVVPEIIDGNWWIDGVDTGVKAEGEDGVLYSDIPPEDITRMWFDTNENILKYYQEGEWVKIEDSELLAKIQALDMGVSSNTASIDLLGGEITASVGEISSVRGITEANTSSIELLTNQLNVDFESIRTDIANNNDKIEALTGIISSGMDSDGVVYTEWFASVDGGNKVRVATDGISMMSGEEETFKVAEGVATATSLYVTKEIGFGNHTARKYGTEYTIFNWNG